MNVVSFRRQYSIASAKTLHLANEFDIWCFWRTQQLFKQQIACKIRLFYLALSIFIHFYRIRGYVAFLFLTSVVLFNILTTTRVKCWNFRMKYLFWATT